MKGYCKVFLVNATAAKCGGAREILERYVEYAQQDERNRYYFFAPGKRASFGGVSFFDVGTSGALTYFFSVFLVRLVAWFFRVDAVVSLNNVNFIGRKGPERITYFHQEKAVRGEGVRFKLIRHNIRSLSGSKIVVQSQRVKERLISELRVPRDSIDVRWPGVRRVCEKISSDAEDILRRNGLGFPVGGNFKKVIFPVYDSSSSHKGIELIREFRLIFSDMPVVTFSMCKPGSGVADYDLGALDAEEMEALYNIADVMVVTSEIETLCLPIFEFSQLGKPIWVRQASYITSFLSSYPDALSNVKVYEANQVQEVCNKVASSSYTNLYFPDDYGVRRLLQGDWRFSTFDKEGG